MAELELRTGRHWRLHRDPEGILWLTLDRAASAVNALSAEVLEELEGFLPDLAGSGAPGLVLRSGKPAGFIAGADVHEFAALSGADQALEHIRRGQELFRRLERLPMPTVAMIHGHCLGGGLELALACARRVASDDPGTRLGLPEVLLGIHPGFGGTVRLTRLLGPAAAMDLMLTGRTVSARVARKLGLVDTVVPERHLARAALAALGDRRPPRRARFLAALPGRWPLRPILAAVLRRKAARRVRPDHYPAPFALIDLWARFGGDPEAMYPAEARSVAELVAGPTARNLVRVFQLQERLKALGRRPAPAVARVHVVGGGVMGGDIAAWCALQGLLVTLQDLDAGRIAQAVARAAQLFRRKLKEPRQVQAALDRLVPDPAGGGAARADLVVEAIVEDADAKRALYRDLEPRMGPDALLATNTSSLPLERLAEGLARPGRFLGLHFFNPVASMQLVEVVHGPGTDPAAVDRALAFAGAIRRLPLPVRSSPGFLVNRVLMPYLVEAMALVEEGHAPAEVDRAALAFGMPMGPVLLADTVGLDVCLSVARILGARAAGAGLGRLERMVAAGQLGRKTGQGFYRFRNGRPEIPSGPGPGPGGPLEQRLLQPLLDEAAACLREGVVADADLLDAGMVFGAGFAPFRGGPLHHAGMTAGQERRLEGPGARPGSRLAPDPG
jgi:3-hydroxyacyl-CoA dehydrogenase/enoyl-CoA hydratase/3-hydroxybutyryl-CoA epimerase